MRFLAKLLHFFHIAKVFTVFDQSKGNGLGPVMPQRPKSDADADGTPQSGPFQRAACDPARRLFPEWSLRKQWPDWDVAPPWAVMMMDLTEPPAAKRHWNKAGRDGYNETWKKMTPVLHDPVINGASKLITLDDDGEGRSSDLVAQDDVDGDNAARVD